MKIKQKKQLNLPQLIDYIWDNNIKNECFRRLNRGPFEYVWVNEDSNVEFDDDMLFRKNDIFEIEVEETVTEDTVFENLIEIYKNPEGMKFSTAYRNVSINYVENDHYLKTLAIYILNDDLTLTLIWRDGKLVD